MNRQAYCTLEALEDIYASQGKADYEALYKLLETHHHINVHLSDVEFDQKLTDNICLRYFAKQASGRRNLELNNNPVPYQEVIESGSNIELAGNVFIVDDDPAECYRQSHKYGICIVSQWEPGNAAYLAKELARKEVRLTTSYRIVQDGAERKGWDALLTPRPAGLQRVPLNALVIVDNYLLGEKGDKLAAGKENIIALLDAILPATLAVDFHLLLVTNNGGAFLKSRNLTNLANSLIKALDRPYEVKVGVVTRRNGPEHRRAIISNYYFGTSHHGFSCFKEHKVEWANDLVISGLFSGVTEAGYDVPWLSMHDELRAVRIRRDKNIKLRNATTGYDDPIHLAFGFCDNRLLNLVG